MDIRQYQRLRQYALTISQEWGEDYLQEAVLRALTNGADNVPAYANACIRTIHIDRLRKEKMRVTVEVEMQVMQTLPVDVSATLTDDEYTIIRAYAEGVTTTDIAGAVGMSERHVRRIIKQIISKCKNAIEL